MITIFGPFIFSPYTKNLIEKLKTIQRKEKEKQEKIKLESLKRTEFFRKLGKAQKLLRSVDQLKRDLQKENSFTLNQKDSDEYIKNQVILVQTRARWGLVYRVTQGFPPWRTRSSARTFGRGTIWSSSRRL